MSSLVQFNSEIIPNYFILLTANGFTFNSYLIIHLVVISYPTVYDTVDFCLYYNPKAWKLKDL